MPFFGLFWLSSWVGCLLASNQGLFRVADYRSTPIPSRFLSVVGSPIEHPIPLVASTQLQSSIWFSNYYRSASSTLNFSPNRIGETLQSKLSPTESRRSSLGLNGVENALCSSVSEQKVEALKLPPRFPSQSASWVEVLPNKKATKTKNTFSQKVLHMVQNLFQGSQQKNQERSPVAVVSINSQNKTSEAAVTDKPRAQLGFWRYSQWLSSPAIASQSLPTAKPESFQIWVKGHLIAQIPDQQQAHQLAQRIADLLQEENLDASQLQPALVDGIPAGKIGDRVLFVIDDDLGKQLDGNRQLLAIEWINHLRTALSTRPLTLVEAQSRLYGLVETSEKIQGITSWYGDYFHGRLTANGETYNQYDLTAAHPSLPFNTFLKVKNLGNGESVIVRVNDRGPYIPPRTLDLSRVAARCIQSEEKGVVSYEAVIMKPLSTQPSATSQKLSQL